VLDPAAKATADRLIAEGNGAEDAGRIDEACARYREAVRAAPEYARAHLNLGVGLEALGEAEGAAASYRAALALEAGNPYAHYNLGKLQFTRGAIGTAEGHLRAALAARPGFAEASVVLGHLLGARGDPQGAAAAFEAGLRERPGDFGAWLGLGQALRALGRSAEAEAAYGRALAMDAGNADVHGALYDLCLAQGKLEAALAHVQAALAQRPGWTDAIYNLGTVLMRLMRLEEAERAFRRLIELDPGYRSAYRMLGGLMLRAARIDETLAWCRAARERFPDSFELESFELFALNFVAEIPGETLFERHRAFGERIERAHTARFAPFRRDADPERPLRVGFVSGDLCYHVVTLFMLPLAERLDPREFELCAYSVGGVADSFTARLRSRCRLWRDAAAMSDTELADAVARDRIDILVDLSGHSGTPRLGVFAQQPAPVQASWVGYLNTTGLRRVHYRITDAFCDPPGLTDRLHTETLVRLPRSQWCYRPFVDVEHADSAPVERHGYLTFGSFNQTAKLSRGVRRLWSEILAGLPDSRLRIAGVADARFRERLLRDFADAGIERGRISVLPHGSLIDYFRWYDEVDIALDTTVYSGGTTTLDALWMGVPVVTAPGERPASRSAAAILTNLGLEDWIAATEGEYVRIAASRARDAARLAELRRTLRARLRASPLMDEAGFARDMASVWRSLWRRWCEGAGRVA
jgi:predicted O-linked N-acetylglucosamine transferase (SPINDLY family)